MTNRTEQTNYRAEQINLPKDSQKVVKRDLSGLILCGGAARRVGGKDKGLLRNNSRINKPLIEQQIAFLKPQVSELAISANRNIHIYQSYGYPVYRDRTGDSFDGPLQGILCGLQNCKTNWLYVQPIDTPNLPHDTIKQLCQSVEMPISKAYYLTSNERPHYLHLLLHISCYDSLNHFVNSSERRVRAYLEEVGAQEVNLGWGEEIFENLNEVEDYEISPKIA